VHPRPAGQSTANGAVGRPATSIVLSLAGGGSWPLAAGASTIRLAGGRPGDRA
jgi:hypothetical protein